MRNFRELEIWKEAVSLSIEVYTIVVNFPDTEKYGLSRQMTRAVVSIPSNIAEGCRGTNKELIYFLNIALGSSFELETQLEIAYRLKYLDKSAFIKLLGRINILQKRINAFRSTLITS